jgi:hypothetical protein
MKIHYNDWGLVLDDCRALPECHLPVIVFFKNHVEPCVRRRAMSPKDSLRCQNLIHIPRRILMDPLRSI